MADVLPLQDWRSEARHKTAPKRLYIFFPGDNSCAYDAQQCLETGLQALDPGAVLVCLNPPIDLSYAHRRWFNLDDIDFQNPDAAEMARRATTVAREIAPQVKQIMHREGVRVAETILAGHSVGGTLALAVAKELRKPVAGVLTLAGGALHELGQDDKNLTVMVAAEGLENHPYCGRDYAAWVTNFMNQSGYKSSFAVLPDVQHEQSCAKLSDLLAHFGEAVSTPPISKTFGEGRLLPLPISVASGEAYAL